MEEIDKSNMIQVIDDFPAQCEEALVLGKNIKIEEEIDNIIICGMGGSAVAGDLLEAYFKFLKSPVKKINKLEIHVKRGYEPPQVTNKKSLVFIVSYSGNTEETISCFKKAHALGAKIIAISSGGEIADLAVKNNVPYIKIPSGIPPRLALGYSFFPMLNVLSNSELIDVDMNAVKKAVISLSPEKMKEEAQKLAQKLVGKIPLIYSSDYFSFIARYWKNNFNENGKIHAFWNFFSELDHNEIVGYTNMQAKFYTIIIQDSSDNIKVQNRMKLTKQLIEEKEGECMILNIKGKTFIGKALSTMMLGMYVSYFLALEYKMDPTPVGIIEDLKKELK